MITSKTAAMKLALVQILICDLFCLVFSSGSHQNHYVTPDFQVLKNYTVEVAESLTLDLPKILTYTELTLEGLIDKYYTKPDHQVMLTVKLKNYSRFKLSHLYTTENKCCDYNNEVRLLKF